MKRVVRIQRPCCCTITQPVQHVQRQLTCLVGDIVIVAQQIDRTVTKPVNKLVAGVREIGRNNYDHRVSIDQEDELGELATAFNGMTEGLVERDKVRNLLGKVVSPEVAHELMRSEIKLGGEERNITAFFSDIAGFTSIPEQLTAPDLVARLEGANKYYGTEIMISEFTHAIVQDKFLCRPLDVVRVQGKQDAIQVYEVIDEIANVTTEQKETVILFEQPLLAFDQRNWLDVKKALMEYRHKTGHSDLSYQLYSQRLASLQANPPPSDWDRIYHLAKG